MSNLHTYRPAKKSNLCRVKLEIDKNNYKIDERYLMRLVFLFLNTEHFENIFYLVENIVKKSNNISRGYFERPCGVTLIADLGL